MIQRHSLSTAARWARHSHHSMERDHEVAKCAMLLCERFLQVRRSFARLRRQNGVGRPGKYLLLRDCRGADATRRSQSDSETCQYIKRTK